MGKKVQPLLSLCVMARDEETNLPRCLQSVKEAVDEIIVVDTGSADNTVSVAKEAGAKVYKKKWNDYFSDVRNYALNKAKGKWILILDADEVLRPEDLPNIRPLLDNPLVEGYLLSIYFDNGAPPTQAMRLYRNRPEYRYQNKVYERIPEHLVANVRETRLVLFHQPDPLKVSKMAKLKGYLLERELDENPEDSYLHYVCGIEHLNRRNYEKAIEHLQESAHYLTSAHLYAPHLYKCLIWSLMELQKMDPALEKIKKGLQMFPFYTDLYFYRGMCHKELQQYKEALEDFSLCMKMGDSPESMIPDPGVSTYRSLFYIGQIHEELMNWDEAIQYYTTAYATEKNFTDPLYKLGNLLKRHKGFSEMEKGLLELINPEKPEDWMTFMDILCVERQYLLALGYIDSLIDAGGEDEAVSFLVGICEMMLGNFEKAELAFSEITVGSLYFEQSVLRRIQNAWFSQDLDKTDQWLGHLDHAHTISPGTIKVYRMVQHNFKGEMNRIEIEESSYFTLARLFEHFVYLGKEERVGWIQELLVDAGQGHLLIEAGEWWIKKGKTSWIDDFFPKIQGEKNQGEFRDRIAAQLLERGEFQKAEDLLKMGKGKREGVVAFYLWNRVWENRLKEFLKWGIRSKKVDSETKTQLALWLGGLQ